MSSSGPTLTQIEVVDIVLTIVAVIVTSFRLCVRARQKRLWIDDAWVALGMIFNFILVIVDCLYLQDYERYPQGARVALYYMCVLFSYTLRNITNTTSGLPNSFTQLYGKIVTL
ncbi:hypothetical protein F4604DRAFT_1789284 [Suillus subluteus]|nr:hypothetical protein F4604DRAFT_1789284 [Suillus subluteus]